MNIEDRVKAAMLRTPTIARLYYGGSPKRRYLRASTNPAHDGDPLVHRSHMQRELTRVLAEAAMTAKEPKP